MRFEIYLVWAAILCALWTGITLQGIWREGRKHGTLLMRLGSGIENRFAAAGLCMAWCVLGVWAFAAHEDVLIAFDIIILALFILSRRLVELREKGLYYHSLLKRQFIPWEDLHFSSTEGSADPIIVLKNKRTGASLSRAGSLIPPRRRQAAVALLKQRTADA